MKHARITLTITQGIPAGEEYRFEKRTHFIVGRADDCDVQLPWDYAHSDVSRHHCRFDIDPACLSVRVRDLGSANGTYVNGLKIGQRPRYQHPEEADLSEYPSWELQDGDEVRVGHTVFRVSIDASSEATQAVWFPVHAI